MIYFFKYTLYIIYYLFSYLFIIIINVIIEYAFNKIINENFPDLMSKIEQPNPPSVQTFLMEYVRNILSIANLQNVSEGHMIYNHKDVLYKEFDKLDKYEDDNEFKKDMEIISIGGLYELANLKGFLTDEQVIINDHLFIYLFNSNYTNHLLYI